jgi:hypothetical protein
MKIYLFLLLGIFSVNSVVINTETLDPKSSDTNVQIALLLDTSGSMSGLIEQAKAQLWNISNDITNYDKNDKATEFEIALYEYGKDDISASEGYVRQLVPFTSDMDHLSEVLFSLKTNGGSEYCGTVIHKSLEELKWNEKTDIKMIYIAGNESFDQGKYPFQKSCKEAKSKEVIVNTIFCGPSDTGVSLQWNAGAILGNGSYHSINHNEATVHIATPQDVEIIRLNSLLNSTYIYYGKNGNDKFQNMQLQDSNANTYGRANYAKRSIYKSKSQYSNGHWDLVDAYKKDNNIITEAKNLPKEYSQLNYKELEKAVLAKQRERARIQEEIKCLSKEREIYLIEYKKKSDPNGLGDSILNSLSEQLRKKGFVKK